MTRRFNLWRTRQNAAPYLFIAPFFILFSIFMLYPFVFSLIISFAKWNGIGKMEWVGLLNYTRLLKDKIFIQTLVNGVVEFFMSVPVMLLLALILAFILHQHWVKYKGFFRTAIFIPNVTSVVAVSYVFLLAFDTQYGLVNMLLGLVGIPQIQWFGSAFAARSVVVLLVIWRWLGYNMILMMSGLSSIPRDLYEAAYIDGASSAKTFTRITLPLMKPIILFCSVMSTMGTFSLFTEPLVLTNGTGGPLNSTMSTVLYIYTQSFGYLKMGYASSIAFVYFIIMFIFTMLQMKVTKASDK